VPIQALAPGMPAVPVGLLGWNPSVGLSAAVAFVNFFHSFGSATQVAVHSISIAQGINCARPAWAAELQPFAVISVNEFMNNKTSNRGEKAKIDQ
jgi:hypothetical protein